MTISNEMDKNDAIREFMKILLHLHFSVVKPVVRPVAKPAPNFGDMHKKMFKKAESIDETQKRHEQRANILLSGKKPATAQSK